MNANQPGAHPSGLKLGDILFVVFRHKWKVVSIALCSIIGAVAFYLLKPVPFESEARLLIRYVLESSSPTASGDSDQRVRSLDERGASIINTELQILTSLDLAQNVADEVGPEKILRKAGGGTNSISAAAVVRNGIKAMVPKDSTVICLAFQHPDPELVRPVLNSLIAAYFKKHSEIHKGAFDQFLGEETDQLKSSLKTTAEELRKEKAKLGITSIPETKRMLDTQLSSLYQQKLATQAELAQRKAMVAELIVQSGLQPGGLSNTNLPSVSSNTNNPVASTNLAVTVPPEKSAEYKRLLNLVDMLSRREQELLMTYTDQNALVRVVRTQLETNERLKTELEAAYPSLLGTRVTGSGTAPDRTSTREELVTGLANVHGLESKLKELTYQLEQARKDADKFYEAEDRLTELQRKLDLEETNYMRFSMNLEQSRIDDRLGPGKISNISKIQEPTPPYPIKTKTMKIAAMILLGGLGLAFGLAFLIEFYLDQTLRRPSEIQPKLGLPLFISIPLQNLNGKAKKLGHAAATPLLQQANGQENPSSALAVSSPGGEIPAWDSRHAMQPFFETLRDRLINYFEVRNLTHKPKLVSVTSCTSGSGVSTIAAGLAASLSETGEGNVLLVDMNNANGSARRFYKGDLACGVDDALEKETREQALVQDKLYVVSESTVMNGLPSALPTRFKALVPRLKASDFDYIIFDMPPVTETSITPRLSKFMDTVLMVVQAEKTDVDVVRRANALLAESKANVGIVLNKEQDYIPRRLQQKL